MSEQKFTLKQSETAIDHVCKHIGQSKPFYIDIQEPKYTGIVTISEDGIDYSVEEFKC